MVHSGRKWGLFLGLQHASHFGAVVTEAGSCFNRPRLPLFFFFRAPAANVEVFSIRRGVFFDGPLASFVLCSACLSRVKDCCCCFYLLTGWWDSERAASCSRCRVHVTHVSHCAKQEVGRKRAQLSELRSLRELLLARCDGQWPRMHLVWSQRELVALVWKLCFNKHVDIGYFTKICFWIFINTPVFLKACFS